MLKPYPSALSEVLGSPLPYDDVLTLRDRMWDISPTLVRYDVSERTSPEVALAGLQTMAVNTASAKVSGKPFVKPISNFYQTDPISRALVSRIVYLFVDSG
jgi:NADH dehydrogenase (ubiquinone) Fe-S protein 1